MAELNDCGYWRYLGNEDVPKIEGSIKHIAVDLEDSGSWDCGGRPVLDWDTLPLSEEDYASQSRSVPRILTRAEKGQALTHLEMDFNLASLFHKVNTSSVGAPYTDVEEDDDSDIYCQRHKPTREEEMRGLFATFSYAPVKNGDQSIIQNPFQTIKIQHTTDEIRYKLSNEQIPGTLDIQEDFRVTGSAFIKENVSVSGNLDVAHDTNTNTLNVMSSSVFMGDIRVSGSSTCSFDGDVYISGNLYVNGIMFGNISNAGYNSLTNPHYATEYQRFGTVGTGSQSDRRLKNNPLKLWDPLYKLSQISGYEFDWAEEAEKSGHDVGLIAQEVQTVLPEAVAEGSDGYLRIDYNKVIPLLVEAVKKLKEEVEWLRNNR